MTRLQIEEPTYNDFRGTDFSNKLVQGIDSSSQKNCPLDKSIGYLRQSQAQSCGKCVPCRIGVPKMISLIEKVIHDVSNEDTLEELKRLSAVIRQTSDCAVGFSAGKFIEEGLDIFADEYDAHIKTGKCTSQYTSIPCVAGCPAHVDIPAYIALAKEQRFEEALQVIRNDNPFPGICAYICEHPCENYCRRNIVDAPVNIRGIKKYIVDNTPQYNTLLNAESTGKNVAVIGGGPSGLTAAYYLSLMGHSVSVYEQNDRLGGMLNYGIPRYRLPQKTLSTDIDAILAQGVKVHFNTRIGEDSSIDELRSNYDALYIAIGAHSSKSARIEGEQLEGVYSAVEVLHDSSGKNEPIEMQGKNVVVIGGGNVAMDVSRTAKRLGAQSVKCVYRRREEDMTALTEEIESAVAEGCELLTLLAPVSIHEGTDSTLSLKVQPQIPGEYAGGRPKPYVAQAPAIDIACDIVVIAIGQDIESQPFSECGFETQGKRFSTGLDALAEGFENVFVGGDCASGPSTVIRAIEAGKVAAANIDEYLGYSHDVHVPVETPSAAFSSIRQVGRINIEERSPLGRVEDFEGVELSLSDEAAVQECGRCLRCDHHGYQAIFERKINQW